MRKPQTFLQIFFLVIVLLLTSSSVLFSSIAHGATAIPDHVTLTWADDPRTTQTITWRTGVTTVGGQVEYAEVANTHSFLNNARVAAAGIAGLKTNLGDMAIHSVTLTGLKSGTRYVYRVGGPGCWSEPRIFTTASAAISGFKFLVFGDSQSINYDVWKSTIRNAYQAHPEAAFFANVGDLVDVGQDYNEWNNWFSAARGVIDTIPAMPITGNHETYTLERQFSMPVFFTAQFNLPPNGPERLKGQVYSFDYGDAHFVMLDSQAGEQAKFVPGMLSEQRIWLEKDLRMTNKKWKIAFIHRPLYNNKNTEANENIERVFRPLFDQYHVDVVFTGHDHVYSRTYPLRDGVRTDTSEKGTVYVASGRSGTKTYRNTISKDWNEFFYSPVDEPNYITVEVMGDVLTVKSFKQSGTLIDAWVIRKATK
ncbi:purple acid phosphatase family protein [Sporomusa malonica]|uniref:Purple acid Phosphatase, N-terminal domain n=1 Tax=Sporomusa malonica TaxID=112901 RepID=A0A1W1ZSD2_9FIRM|nr:metallophosphoesterase family protein [Sporomusa malonica]SMC51410.1 Purple acid Phosphatase, N-terminal domain [Sporomusa malonica]